MGVDFTPPAEEEEEEAGDQVEETRGVNRTCKHCLWVFLSAALWLKDILRLRVTARLGMTGAAETLRYKDLRKLLIFH